jgi:hypothetical protein
MIVGRFMEDLLFGVAPLNPSAFSAVTLVLVVVAAT